MKKFFLILMLVFLDATFCSAEIEYISGENFLTEREKNAIISVEIAKRPDCIKERIKIIIIREGDNFSVTVFLSGLDYRRNVIRKDLAYFVWEGIWDVLDCWSRMHPCN